MAAFFGVVYVAVMLSFILSDQKSSRWQIYCMADLPLLLGMRYLCILCGYADRQAQDGTGTQSEEISRRSCGRRGRSCTSWRDLCSSNTVVAMARICSDLRRLEH